MPTNVSQAYIAVNGQINSGVVKLANLATEAGNANKTYQWDGSGVPTATSPGYALVQTQTLAATNTTFTFSSLDLNTAGYYVLVFNLITAEASNRAVIQINGDTTANHYQLEISRQQNATLNSARENTNDIIDIRQNAETFGTLYITRGANTGKAIIQGTYKMDIGSAITTCQVALQKDDASVANITQIVIKHPTGAGFGIGSTVSLYSMGR
jgi:hypothetical protein